MKNLKKSKQFLSTNYIEGIKKDFSQGTHKKYRKNIQYFGFAQGKKEEGHKQSVSHLNHAEHNKGMLCVTIN